MVSLYSIPSASRLHFCQNMIRTGRSAYTLDFTTLGYWYIIANPSLSSSPTSMSLLAIIPAKPHLLLLIRIAPYPYNLLNVILASSPGLSLKTYMGCTAISLLKVILHTWFGSGIHDISELHRHNSSGPNRPDLHHHHHHSNQSIETMEFNGNRENIKVYWTWGGLILCVVLFFYLHHVAKKAIERAQADVERENRLEEGQVMVTVGR